MKSFAIILTVCILALHLQGSTGSYLMSRQDDEDFYYPDSNETETEAPTTTSTTTTTTTTTTQAPAAPSGSESCIIPSSSKIVGGSVAVANSRPYIAHIVIQTSSSGSWSCGATIISKEWIMTAAHCTTKENSNTAVLASEITASIREHDITTSTDNEERIKASNLVVHSSYDYPVPINDIALIKLEKAITFDNKAKPACLPTAQNNPATDSGTAIVAGWGTTTQGGSGSALLKWTEVDLLIDSSCKVTAAALDATYNGYVSDTMICGYKEETDSCQGDSGGPLTTTTTVTGGQKVTVIGVVSFGAGCAQPGRPGVYAQVGAYLPWIKSTTGL